MPYCFMVPWEEHTIVGTAYDPEDAGEQALEAFLADARRAFFWLGLEAEEVSLVHRGLVPGRGGETGLWAHHRIVDHHSAHGLSGLMSIVGVKYTTARRVAERTLRRVEAWRKRPLTAPREDLPPSVPGPPSWKEFEILLREDENAARAELHRLVAEESVLSPEDLVLRRTDWGMDPSRAQSRAALVAPLLPGDLPRVEPDA